MKMLNMLTIAAMMAMPLAIGACSEEVSHTETDKPGWFGGHKHEETTVRQNPDGSMSTEHSKTTVNP